MALVIESLEVFFLIFCRASGLQVENGMVQSPQASARRFIRSTFMNPDTPKAFCEAVRNNDVGTACRMIAAGLGENWIDSVLGHANDALLHGDV
ncbi:MAG: hypothetical protein IKJ58_04250 [Akkermansia sp.]|nr:hypothetical protein [Akkermansia sp.]